MGNMIQCKRCRKILHSMYRHDFQACDCAKDGKYVFVDGGFDYGRVGGYPEDIIEIFHVHDPNDKNKLICPKEEK